MGPKDVEKTITWRLEKAVSATPGVDHVESISRSGLSIIFVWLKWGTDLNAAQSSVQQQVAFAMSSVPKSLGIIPPFVLQYDPSNAPVMQVAVYGGGLSGRAALRLRANNVEPLIEGIAGVASASLERRQGAPDQHRRRSGEGARRAASRRATLRGRSSARTRCCRPGDFNPPTFSANVYTNAVPTAVARHRRRRHQGRPTARPVSISDVARIEDGGSKDARPSRSTARTRVYLNVLRVPGGNVVAINDRDPGDRLEPEGPPARA